MDLKLYLLIIMLLILEVKLFSGQDNVVDISPREAVRRAGENLIVLCRVPYPIESCRIQVGPASYRLQPENTEGDIVYAGRGLASGECGAEIKNILKEWNGKITCFLPAHDPKNPEELKASMNLIVAKPPDNPILEMPSKPYFTEGEEIQARCTVRDGRPAANISWYMDDKPLLSNLARPQTESAGDLSTVSQNISLTLTAEQSGRQLTCKADHPALDHARQASQQIKVYLPSANIRIQNTLDRVFYDGDKITISCKGHKMPENSRNELITIFKNDISAVLGWSTHKKFSRKLTLNPDMRAFYCLVRTDHNIKGDNVFSSKRMYITVQNECGLVTPQGQELVIGGRPATHAELPWHAGIYQKTTTPYQQICGGSLVSPTVVISAAHCFWDPWSAKAMDASQFAVALGKIYRFWDNPLDVNVQKSDVSDIKIPMHFRGSDTNFQDDIAIVILATAIVYKPYIRPVCLDFDADLNKKQLQPWNLGKVAGYGLTTAERLVPTAQVLRIMDLLYVDTDMCFIMTPPVHQKYITSDKICAGWMNGTALCRGDSGGGLVFPDLVGGKLRYYLRGLASTAPTNNNNGCNAYSFIGFTQIYKHEDFIKENY